MTGGANIDYLAIRRRQERTRRIIYAILPFVSLLLLLLGWLYLAASYPNLFPTPRATWERLLRLFARPISRMNLFGHIWASLRRVLSALALAWILGNAFGILIGWNRKAKALFGGVFEMLRPIPPLAWIPLITMWMGIGEAPKIILVLLGCFAPVAINAYTGIRLVDPLHLDVGRMFNASNWRLLREIAVPAALPAIFAGIRTSTSSGWMTVLAAEMMGARSGLGFLIIRGMEADDMALIMVGMITIGVIGAMLAVAVTFAERKICPWRARQLD
ncbi:MAG: ABC transporter permease [Planctomycetes bacterium]|nr:ABC transporter permease [Planctomycetota bacterium]